MFYPFYPFFSSIYLSITFLSLFLHYLLIFLFIFYLFFTLFNYHYHFFLIKKYLYRQLNNSTFIASAKLKPFPRALHFLEALRIFSRTVISFLQTVSLILARPSEASVNPLYISSACSSSYIDTISCKLSFSSLGIFFSLSDSLRNYS